MNSTPTLQKLQSSSNIQIPIHRADGKRIGKVKGQVFYKSVKSSRHLLRHPIAWAIDESSLEEAKQAGAIMVQIRDIETGAIFRSLISDIETKGFTFNRGCGLQIGLRLEDWVEVQKDREKPKKLHRFVSRV